MRVPFDLVFETSDAGIAPRMTVALGAVTIARGVTLNPIGSLGGIRLADLPHHDLDVETSGAILTVKKLLTPRGNRRVDPPRRTTISGSGSASAA